MRHFAGSLIIVLPLLACSPPTQDPTPKIVEDQRQALEKAKELDAELQRSAEEQAKRTQTQTE